MSDNDSQRRRSSEHSTIEYTLTLLVTHTAVPNIDARNCPRHLLTHSKLALICFDGRQHHRLSVLNTRPAMTVAVCVLSDMS